MARRAGVSEALAYYHFQTKAGLLAGVVQDFYARLDEAVAAVPFEGDTWAARERARISALVAFMYRDPLAPLLASGALADPSLLADQRDRQRRLEVLGARNIARAQRDGEIDPARDPKLLVAMLLAGAFAGVTEALASEPRKRRSRTEREIWAFVKGAAGIVDPHTDD